jgi:hypothetical protein
MNFYAPLWIFNGIFFLLFVFKFDDVEKYVRVMKAAFFPVNFKMKTSDQVFRFHFHNAAFFSQCEKMQILQASKSTAIVFISVFLFYFIDASAILSNFLFCFK